jgi:hypothetical protein
MSYGAEGWLRWSSKFDGILDSGGQSARVCTAEGLDDRARAKDNEGRHTKECSR